MCKTQRFWNELSIWAQATFGSDDKRGPLGPLKHLEKEAKEAQENAEQIQRLTAKTTLDSGLVVTVGFVDPQVIKDLDVEIADCLFLTFDAARRAGMSLDDLLDTAFQKLEINRNRTWNSPSNDGVVEHVRE